MEIQNTVQNLNIPEEGKPDMPIISESKKVIPNVASKKPNGVLKGFGIAGVAILVITAAVALLGYLYIAKPALSLMSHINDIKADMTSITNAMGARDLVVLEEALKKMEIDLDDLKGARDAEFGWMKNQTLFKLNEFYSDSDRFIKAGHLAIKALRQTMDLVTPFADAAGLRVDPSQQPPAQDGLMEAFQTWVSLMPEVADNMDEVLITLNELGEELAPINTSKYPEEFRGIRIRDNVEFAKNTLSQAKEYTPDIKAALTIFPRLLGVGSFLPKRYMIIMQNNMEIRPTGGFWTNYATFKIKDGLLQSDFTSKDFYSIDYVLDTVDAYYDFPDAPPAYTKYLQVERWYSRDTNSSPDLPTSIDQFLFYYNMGMKIDPVELKPIDGIITIDTQVIKELIEVTGPVTVNGITYNSENVVLELERLASLNVQEQRNRKGVLGDLMEAMLINVFESDKFLWSQLIDKGVSLGIRKHIQGYLFDPEGQKLLEKYNLAGRIADPVEGDYSAVISTNLGGDKTNWFTHKSINHTLANENGRWVRTVEITYKYDEPSSEYAPFIKRFRDWVRVYAPAGSELISFEGSEDTTAVGTGKGQERGKEYFFGYVELGPGESKTLKVRYYLPENTVGAGKYSIFIQKQAGIEAEKHTVTVNGRTTELTLDRDKKLEIRL